MVLADLIFILGSVLGLVSDKFAFAFARFIMGVSVGLNTSVILSYIREISPDEYTKKTCSIFSAFLNLGIILGLLVSLPLPRITSNINPENSLWRLVIVFPALVCLLRILLLLFVYNLDTPFFYYSNNMPLEGRRALERLYDEQSVQEVENAITGGGVDQPDKKRAQTAFDSVISGYRSPSQKSRLVVGMCINFLQQMTGITMITAYSMAVFGGITNDSNKQDVLVLCGYIVLLLSSLAQLFLDLNVGRRSLLQIGYSALGVLLLALGIMNAANVANNSFLQIASVTVIYLFFITYNLTVGPFTNILTSEIVKDEAMSYSVLMNWLGNIISLCMNFNQHYWVNYILFCGFCFLGLFYTSYFVKETKGKTFQEIQLIYHAKSKEAERNIMDSMNTSSA